MDLTSCFTWQNELCDPSGIRAAKPRKTGLTMVIDKGLGLHAFKDMLQSAASHIDLIKIGFGTSPLYPASLLRHKLQLAAEHQICVFPGGTFLEVAVRQQAVPAFFDNLLQFGFTGVEISDGTIEMERSLRSRLIRRGSEEGLRVFTEYGKKLQGSAIELNTLGETVELDLSLGAELVTIEGRESGSGVGIYDTQGECNQELVFRILEQIPQSDHLLWEAPNKSGQVQLIKSVGADVSLGNISPQDVFSLEALRRGLRADTFDLGHVEPELTYEI
ncbi:phosphosulfolactate synthase [Paenibacillus sp. y28]|uniref:phosphosulfolactate synthase n=1 Tax=Paenibacillus sp. y28 TaxID=3129110 RepID=UPI003018DD31